jgi:hypothetical protein
MVGIGAVAHSVSASTLTAQRATEIQRTMTSQTQKALQLPKHDADFILAPVAEAMLGSSLPKEKVQEALTEAAKRVLRVALNEAGIEVAHFELDVDAASIAERLIESVAGSSAKLAA